jgi:uncharacterized protein YgfB (UPF0149 family)
MRTLTETDATAARVARAELRAGEFSLEAYLADQERFVADAAAALGVGEG